MGLIIQLIYFIIKAMKSKMFVVVIMSMLGILSFVQNVKADKVKPIVTTFTRYDDRVTNPDNPCTLPGSDCMGTVPSSQSVSCIISPNPSGGWSMSVTRIDTVMAQVIANNVPYSFMLNDKTITFPTGSVFEITDCVSYPTLVGRLVDVGGITTDSNGSFTVNFN